MKPRLFPILPIALAVILAAGAAWGGGVRDGATGMSTQHGVWASPESGKYDPFPEDVAAVESAWGAPLPDHLVTIGGVDWWSWAAVQMVVENGEATFRGEYLDTKLRYKGDFLYRHPRGDPLPDRVFERYVMSHISNIELVFVKDDDSVPRDYFFLVPADPERVEMK